jgi:hypothetical protein
MNRKFKAIKKSWRIYFIIIGAGFGSVWLVTRFSGMQSTLLSSWFTQSLDADLLRELARFFYLPVKKLTAFYRYLTGLNYLWQIMMIIFLTLSAKLLFWLNAYKKSTRLPVWKKTANINYFLANYQQYMLLSVLITLNCIFNSYLLLFNHRVSGYLNRLFYLTGEMQLLFSLFYMVLLTLIGGLLIINLHINYRQKR